jgi:hypothetical protein
MKLIDILKVALVLQILIICSNSGYSQLKTNRETVVGHVVAFDTYWGHFCITSSPCAEVFIIKEDSKHGESRYIKAQYVFWPGKGVMREIANGAKWKFRLQRNKKCDESFEDLNYARAFGDRLSAPVEPRMELVPGNENILIPEKEVLSCYDFTVKDVAPVKEHSK